MKLFALTAIGLCVVTGSICTPVPSPDGFTPADFSLQKRVLIGTINDIPQQDIDCNGYILPVNQILEALSQGVRWASTDPITQKSTGKYPHTINNYANLPFPNCEGGTLYEFPVMRTIANPWNPGENTVLNSKGNPDRVVFTVTDSDTGTYCGVVTKDPNNKTNSGGPAFMKCTP